MARSAGDLRTRRRRRARPGQYAPGGRGATMKPAPAHETSTTYAPPAPAQPSEEVRRLGDALNERKEEVLRRTVVKTRRDSPLLDALVRDSFERICLLTTAAVARWMAGDDPETTMAVGREAGQIFGQLAGRRAAPLHEVIKRCVRWRKVTAEVLGESAAQLGVSQEALFDAL